MFFFYKHTLYHVWVAAGRGKRAGQYDLPSGVWASSSGKNWSAQRGLGSSTGKNWTIQRGLEQQHGRKLIHPAEFGQQHGQKSVRTGRFWGARAWSNIGPPSGDRAAVWSKIVIHFPPSVLQKVEGNNIGSLMCWFIKNAMKNSLSCCDTKQEFSKYRLKIIFGQNYENVDYTALTPKNRVFSTTVVLPLKSVCVFFFSFYVFLNKYMGQKSFLGKITKMSITQHSPQKIVFFRQQSFSR